MTSKNEIRNQQKLQQNMCMGGKKRIREKKQRAMHWETEKRNREGKNGME